MNEKPSKNEEELRPGLGEYALIFVLVAVVVTGSLMILGPIVGTIFSKVNYSLCGMCGTTVATLETSVPITPAAQGSSIGDQLEQIDQALKQSLAASIAYNAPAIMKLDESTTIVLLLNPAISPEALATQVNESGQVVKGSIEITPRMKAVLKTQEQDAFDIQPLHDSPEQVISGTDTTKWSWFVTAKKRGLHRVTLIVYRLVKFDGQDYWREVETYKADIDVKVTFVQQVQAFDWKWIAGIVLTLIGIPALWRYIDNRNKKMKKRTK